MSLPFVYRRNLPEGQTAYTPNVQWMESRATRTLNVEQITALRHENSLKVGCTVIPCLKLNEMRDLHCLHIGLFAGGQSCGSSPG